MEKGKIISLYCKFIQYKFKDEEHQKKYCKGCTYNCEHSGSKIGDPLLVKREPVTINHGDITYIFDDPVVKEAPLENGKLYSNNFLNNLPSSSVTINGKIFDLYFCKTYRGTDLNGLDWEFGVGYLLRDDPNTESYAKSAHPYRSMTYPGSKLIGLYNDGSVTAREFKTIVFKEDFITKNKGADELVKDIWQHMYDLLTKYFKVNAERVRVRKHKVLFAPPQYYPYKYVFDIKKIKDYEKSNNYRISD